MPGYVDRPPDLVAELRKMRADIYELQQRVRGAAFLNPVIAVVTGGAASLTSGATTDLTFSGAAIDTAGMWDAGTPDRLTVPRAGVYVMVGEAQIAPDGSGTGVRTVEVVASTSPTTQSGFTLTAPAANGFNAAAPAMTVLEAGDTIQLFCSQSSGSTLAASGGVLAAAWLGVSS